MFGQFIKEERLKGGMGLREFCRKLSLDASNWSKVERGVMPPPKDEAKLEAIASALDIELNTEKWQELEDMANIASGIIPKDLLSDREVLNSLPMFFRTLRSEKPTSTQLDKLIDKIRKEK
jgi:transcriptional regulator with XRE-family HTH domain